MKSDGSDNEVLHALREVQEWKASVWEDVQYLPYDEAVRIIAQRAHRAATDLGFHAIEIPAHSRRVAESGSAYRTKGE